MELIFFYIFAIVALASAIAVISIRNPVHSAIFLMVCFLQVAALFVLLRSPFLAAVQIFVYVGAVMVLFLFAVLILDLGRERFGEYLHHQSPIAIIVVVGVIFVIGLGLARGKLDAPLGKYTEAELVKNIEVTGELLYTKYVFPFEVISLLLLVAMVGAIVLVMKERK
ncbi:MAG TPA: NADH-quinone oxidoreductase subunit J [Deltaproteobacteria bacterium]|nr:NADH-quinone oxidoreductase subunit J [Deltaproteobacteria bacterium]